MSTMPQAFNREFESFSKIPRLTREAVITEKIDGTNAQIYIGEGGEFLVGSRTRWITPGKETDNYGFAAWAYEHKEELLKLGPGRHFGEWWGSGIQRGYGIPEKRFSLFNCGRWMSCSSPREDCQYEISGVCDIENSLKMISCCHVVPTIWRGDFSTFDTDNAVEMLRIHGSFASPGFTRPEGIVVYHTAAKKLFKKLLENDSLPKGTQ